MALTSQQSQQLYGTTAYAGWPELEASNDARFKGLSGGGEFNFESEVDKAFQELGGYYGRLLDEAGGDLNKALSRLQEDYDTGKRFKMQNFALAGKAIDLAQESFSVDANKAFKTLSDRQLARGISRQSAFSPTEGLGIADTEQADLRKDVSLGQEQLDLRRKAGQTEFDQTGELADIGLSRSKTDLPEQFDRYKRELEEQRKKDAGSLALSRQQRAYQRFEAGLI